MGKTIGKVAEILYLISRKLLNSANTKNASVLVRKTREDRDLYRTPEGDFFWLNGKSWVDQNIINTGIFEKESTLFVKKSVKSGDVVFDVGANIGYYTVILSKLVGINGNVYAFEPTDCFREVLVKNVSENKIQNCQIFEFGLSNKEAVADIEIEASSATMHVPGGLHYNSRQQIKLKTLDSFVEEKGINRIDFIKVDIDGHEPLFLAGAWQTLKKLSPVVLLEISHLHYLEAGTNAWDFYNDLKGRGYFIYSEKNLCEFKSKIEFLQECANFAYSSNVIISKNPISI